MNNNKVVLGDQTIMDISDSTVTPNNLLNGEIGYSGNGDRVVGTANGGHSILNDNGTALAQKDNLQFKGVYSHNVGDNSEVDIVREFQSVAEIEALTGEAKKGFEVIEDSEEYIPYTGSDILFDNTDTSFTGTDVQEVLEEVDGKIDTKAEIKRKTVSVTIDSSSPSTGNITVEIGVGVDKVVSITPIYSADLYYLHLVDNIDFKISMRDSLTAFTLMSSTWTVQSSRTIQFLIVYVD